MLASEWRVGKELASAAVRVCQVRDGKM